VESLPFSYTRGPAIAASIAGCSVLPFVPRSQLWLLLPVVIATAVICIDAERGRPHRRRALAWCCLAGLVGSAMVAALLRVLFVQGLWLSGFWIIALAAMIRAHRADTRKTREAVGEGAGSA
jgi:hypothetical protein